MLLIERAISGHERREVEKAWANFELSKTTNISILNGKWEDDARSNDLKGNSRIAYCNKTVQNVSMWSTILRQTILMHIYVIANACNSLISTRGGPAMEYQVGSMSRRLCYKLGILPVKRCTTTWLMCSSSRTKLSDFSHVESFDRELLQEPCHRSLQGLDGLQSN